VSNELTEELVLSMPRTCEAGKEFLLRAVSASGGTLNVSRALVLDIVEEWGAGELFKLVDIATPERKAEFSEERRRANLDAICRKSEAQQILASAEKSDADLANFEYAMRVAKIRDERDQRIMSAAQNAFR